MVQLVSRKDGIEKIRQIMQEVRIALLTTENFKGELHSRPMIAQDTEFDGDLWFFSSRDSVKVGEIRKSPRVNISYLGSSGYVSLAGKARIVEDVAKKRELWHEPLRVWFEDGPESPDVVLICIEAESGHYWDGMPGNARGRMINVVKMLLLREEKSTGELDNVIM